MVCGSFVHRSLSPSLSVCAAVCGAVALVSPPSHPLFFFLPLFRQCGRCLKWGVMARLWGFASHGVSTLSRGLLATVEALGYSQAPTFNLSEAVG